MLWKRWGSLLIYSSWHWFSRYFYSSASQGCGMHVEQQNRTIPFKITPSKRWRGITPSIAIESACLVILSNPLSIVFILSHHFDCGKSVCRRISESEVAVRVWPQGCLVFLPHGFMKAGQFEWSAVIQSLIQKSIYMYSLLSIRATQTYNYST